MVTIVGAGPVGCYAASLLAREGEKVTVLEEHEKIGEPVLCTGLVTPLIRDIVKIDPAIIVNEIRRARIYSPKGNVLEARLKEKNIVIDRAGFDRLIAENARAEGARIMLGKRFKTLDKKGTIIGADGPNSAVARQAGLWGRRRFWTGIQARIKVENENIIEFYPFIGTYAWVVPEDEKTAMIGVAAERNAMEIFRRFLMQRAGRQKAVKVQAGLIPRYDPKQKACSKNVFLAGDAAGHVKATTGGGIIPGLRAAACLARSILENRDYEKDWRRKIGLELWLHLKAREMMDRFSPPDWDRLTAIMSRRKNRHVLESAHRDNALKMAAKLVFREPALLYFMKHLFS